jgi:sialate O-acetylesterase
MNNKMKVISLVFLLGLLMTVSSVGQVRLPRLISDGVILQRDADVKIWGWASPDEKITIRFINETYQTSANTDGDWSIVLKGLKAGGPYKMEITGKNSITVSDILVGDVWVCSGQSNMELPMRRVSWVYPTEIANSTNPNIRQFVVPQKYDFKKPHTDLSGGNWKSVNPQSVLDFSAVAYFFAKEIYEKYKVPIGLINASLGGSPAEAWMSEEALKKFPAYYQEAQKFKDDSLIKRIETQDNARSQAWYRTLSQKDEGYKEGKNWRDPMLNTSGWLTMKIPGYWANTSIGPVNGIVWFRKDIDVPASMVGTSAKLILGRIVDGDSAFVNGVFVGTVSYQYPPRRYDVPAGLLKEGKNTIVVKIISNGGKGGFVPDKPYQLEANGKTIDLKGDWQMRLAATMDPLPGQTFIRWKPEGLYNAMIHPLLNYRVKGVIWYQGESNAGKPEEYRELFPAMIRDWRTNWQQGDFPFLFVQLANFMEPRNEPGESGWAMLREAQLKTLALPNTGMAVISDIGEWNDIHPLNKKDVGKRLALAAQKIAYGENKVVYSGPIYQSMKIDGNKITLSFSNVGGGLITKGGSELKYFAIADADKKFVWAKAKIEGDKVVVWNDQVPNPVAVRYAWADDPEGANLYNKEGLPASSFRTDN